MISAVNLELYFGERVLFDEISFMIGPHDRIGLVGSNGAGKSTLLKILVGQESADHGQIEKAKYVSVGYLPQDGMIAVGKTLYHEVESAFGDIIALQQELEDVHAKMAEVGHENPEFTELLEIYGELQHKLEDSDAFRLKSKIEKILIGLGFSTDDMDRSTDEFSGGWQMRIALAKLLLIQPSLLLLDEPTNHLDLDSLQWLEEYLESYDGAIMLVSHDRRFLNKITTKTYELSLGQLSEYTGNYSSFVVQKEERKQLILSAQKNQQSQLKQTERFIERFRYKATKARQVQSRIKQMEKVELIEVEDEEESIHFEFPPAPPGGRSVMEIRKLHKSYGDLQIFDGIDFDIDRGDKIAFVGVNGAGKSTMSRIIAGVEPFQSGDRKVGYNVTVGYFAQHQAEELNMENDVLQTVDEVATGEIRKKLRTLLGCFLFSGDDVFKKVKVLSGGEKSRLALAKMLLQPANLIVMDEPTNHLDMRSKTILQEALQKYEGSFVIVSHDRDFLDPIVNKVVEFKKGHIKTYIGNVSEYLYARERAAQPPPPPSLHHHVKPAAGSSKAAISEKDRKRIEAEKRQERSKRTKPIQDKLNTLEKTIAKLEAQKVECETTMADPEFYKNGEHVKNVTSTYKSLEKQLADAYYNWNELTRQLERETT